MIRTGAQKADFVLPFTASWQFYDCEGRVRRHSSLRSLPPSSLAEAGDSLLNWIQIFPGGSEATCITLGRGNSWVRLCKCSHSCRRRCGSNRLCGSHHQCRKRGVIERDHAMQRNMCYFVQWTVSHGHYQNEIWVEFPQNKIWAGNSTHLSFW